MAKDPNAKFSLQDLLTQIGSGAISGLVFGAGGTAANRANVNDRYGAPDVIEQTGKEKEAPAEISLHLADGQVQGLPMVEKLRQSRNRCLWRKKKTPPGKAR